MIKRITAFMAMAVLFVGAVCAREYAPQDVPNVNKVNRTQFVSDPADLLSAMTTSRVNSMLYNLRKETTAEVAVVVIPSTGDLTIEEYAEKLFTLWGLGKSDKDNGVLFIVAVDDHDVRIQTGYGVEGILPDIAAAKIIREVFIPEMRKGDLDEAVYSSTAALCKVMTDPEARAELLSKKKNVYDEDEDTLDIGVFFWFMAFCVVFFLICSVCMYFSDVKSTKKGVKRDPAEMARTLMNHENSYLAFAILSVGLGTLFLWLARRKVKKLRNMPHKCYNCGHKMVKLDEVQDNARLDAAQDLEERLNTVDYDVWVCPQCDAAEKIPFRIPQSKYTECPKCHTIAMHLYGDKVLQKATTRSAGVGEKTYMCEYCGHQKKERYTIPKKEDGAVVAGAIAGAMLGSGGRGGGGSFGGGFGGGLTGGGGASGHW